MSLFKKYKEEREDAIVVEDERGFASAVKLEDHLYIDEVYILPEHRKKNVATDFADKLAEVAKELGYKKLLSSVDIKANGSTISMKVLLSYGFELQSAEGSLIFLQKEI